MTVGLVALDTTQGKARFHPSGKVHVGMRGDGRNCRRAGAIVTGVTKRIVLKGRIKDQRPGTGMRPVTGSTGIGKDRIVTVRVALGESDPRQAQAQEHSGYKEQ
jgi:hypothetical protein